MTQPAAPVELFHGTSRGRLAAIDGGSLDSPYLTDSEDLAWYYAEEQSDADDTDPVVLRVAVDPARLLADGEAWAEPVSAGICRLADMEAARDAHTGPVTAQVTLRIVRSVRVDGAVEICEIIT